MRKIFILMLCMIFLVGTVSAFEFDNIGQYNKETKTMNIKNAFGFGKNIAEIRLDTQTSEKLHVGYKKVAQFTINPNENYNGILNSLKLYDKRNGLKSIQRQVDIKYLTTESFEVNDYSCSDSLFGNGTTKTDCFISGSHFEEREVWEDFNGNVKQDEPITIGLFTEVLWGDYVEWIPEIAGVEITQWADFSNLDVNFTNFEVFNITGTNFFIVPTDITEVAVLIVAGAGRGGQSDANGVRHAGGGGAGGLIFNISIPVTPLDNLTVVVGTGGPFGVGEAPVNGTGSSFDGIDAFQGGGGGAGSSQGGSAFGNGRRGGSGGGGGCLNASCGLLGVGNQTPGNGNDGVAGLSDVGGGGGGAGSAGSGEDGGSGLTIWGLSWANGGNGTSGSGSGDGTNASANTGDGGGGGFFTSGTIGLGGSGASGVVIVAWNVAGPTINLDSPANNTNFTLTNNVTFNATIFDDTNITNVTLYINDLINETNTTAGLNNTLWTFNVVGFAEGDTDWNIEACNDNICGNATARTFNVNTTPNIQYGVGVPINEFNTTDDFFEVNVTLTETLFENVTFDLYTTLGTLNQTVTFTNSSRSQNWTNLIDGSYSYNVTTATSTLQFNSTETRNISIDSTFPIIIVTSPTGDQGTFSTGTNLTLTWTATDINLDVCQYDYQGFNTTVACGSSPINLTVNDSTQTSLTFYVNDTFGQTSFNSTNWSYSFIENNITFTPNVFETDSQFFEINLSTSLNVSAISAELNYNGTNFISSAACGDFCLVNNTIDIPLVSSGEFENKSFFWEISIFNGTDSINVNTSSTEQNVTRIHLEECDGSFTVETLNFTVYDEQNLTRIDPFLFDGDFEQWLGEGTVKRQSNFTQSSISEQTLCLSPEDETFFIDATIEYDEAGNASLYTLRNYYFQNDTISNVTQETFMYLLQSSFSTSFILKVQDDALLPVANVLIETNRFYPGLNEFRIVQIAKTDDLGKSVGFFETEIVDYKFIITFNNDTLLETGIQKVIPESSPFTLTFNLGDNLGEPWISQIPIVNLISTLIWNDITGIITYTYTDNSTNLTLARLFVIQQSLVNSSADSTICNENSSLTSAILTCDVGNDSGFYTASSFITRDSIETLDLQITFQIETLSAIVGLLGLFYGWFLILIASFMFRFNEIAGIWSITIVVLLVNLIGLINFGGVFVTATLGVAILLTWLMSN